MTAFDRAFVGDFHSERAGITEDLLAMAIDDTGRTPYGWLCDGLPPSGPVLDLACGSAPVADVVGRERYEGVDRSAAELAVAGRRRPGVRLVEADLVGRAREPAPAGPDGRDGRDGPDERNRRGGLNGPSEPVAAVTCAMAAMLVGLENVLAAAASRLPPGGPVHLIVPTRDPPIAPEGDRAAYGLLLSALGQGGVPYPDPLAPADLPARARAEGFDLMSDELGWFDRPLRGPADIELVLRSFYGAGADAAAYAVARALLEPLDVLPYPIRRIVLSR